MIVPQDRRQFLRSCSLGTIRTIRTVGRLEVAYDDEIITLADDLVDALEGGPYALFFTPNEKTGIALEAHDDDLMIYLFVYYVDEEIWVRNSPGIVEIRIPSDWEDAWEALAFEVLKVMPDFDLEETEEIPAECVGGEDMSECWSQD